MSAAPPLPPPFLLARQQVVGSAEVFLCVRSETRCSIQVVLADHRRWCCLSVYLVFVMYVVILFEEDLFFRIPFVPSIRPSIQNDRHSTTVRISMLFPLFCLCEILFTFAFCLPLRNSLVYVRDVLLKRNKMKTKFALIKIPLGFIFILDPF